MTDYLKILFDQIANPTDPKAFDTSKFVCFSLYEDAIADGLADFTLFGSVKPVEGQWSIERQEYQIRAHPRKVDAIGAVSDTMKKAALIPFKFSIGEAAAVLKDGPDHTLDDVSAENIRKAFE